MACPQPDAAAAWRTECERAAAQLVITAPPGAPDAGWRPQLERALDALGSLQAAAPGARAAVDASAARLDEGAEAAAAAEAAAEAALADLRAEHRAALAAVASLRGEAEARREYVAQLQQELAFLQGVSRDG